MGLYTTDHESRMRLLTYPIVNLPSLSSRKESRNYARLSFQVKNNLFCRGSGDEWDAVFLFRVWDGIGVVSSDTPWTASLIVSFERQKSM